MNRDWKVELSFHNQKRNRGKGIQAEGTGTEEGVQADRSVSVSASLDLRDSK